MVKPETWMKLTPHVVQDIHKKGGTILVSDRGKFVLPSYASFECMCQDWPVEKTGVRPFQEILHTWTLPRCFKRRSLLELASCLCIFPTTTGRIKGGAPLRLTKVLFFVAVMLLQGGSGSQSLISKEYQAILRHWRWWHPSRCTAMRSQGFKFRALKPWIARCIRNLQMHQRDPAWSGCGSLAS